MKLRYAGNFNNHTTAICPQNVTVEKLWKSVNIWRRYGQSQSGTFFWNTAYIATASNCSASLIPSWIQFNTHCVMPHDMLPHRLSSKMATRWVLWQLFKNLYKVLQDQITVLLTSYSRDTWSSICWIVCSFRAWHICSTESCQCTSSNAW